MLIKFFLGWKKFVRFADENFFGTGKNLSGLLMKIFVVGKISLLNMIWGKEKISGSLIKLILVLIL